MYIYQILIECQSKKKNHQSDTFKLLFTKVNVHCKIY